MVLLVKSEGIGTKGRPEKPAATTALINRAAGMNAQIWVRIIGRIYSLIFFLAYSFVTSAINIFLPIGADYRDRYSRMNFIRWKDPVLYITLRFRYAPRSCNYRNVDEKRDVQSARVSFAQRGGGGPYTFKSTLSFQIFLLREKVYPITKKNYRNSQIKRTGGYIFFFSTKQTWNDHFVQLEYASCLTKIMRNLRMDIYI